MDSTGMKYDVVQTDAGPRRAVLACYNGLKTEYAVQERRCAKGYRVTDPETLQRQLMGGGFDVEILRVKRSLWKHIVVARDLRPWRDARGEEHRSEASILCAHDGRTAYRITPTAVRLACENQFKNEAIHIAHTDSEIDTILQDPVYFIRNVLHEVPGIADRVIMLRGSGNGEDILNLVQALGRKRLLSALTREFEAYAYHEGRRDFEVAIQAMTRTKRPLLVKLASRAINADFEDMLHGRVPQTWAGLLETTKRAPQTLS